MGVNDFIDENLLHFLTGSTAAAFFVAMISTFFTEAVKRTCQKVFLKKSLGKRFVWSINFFLVLVVSMVFVLLTGVDRSLMELFLSNIFVVFFAWPISILAYEVFLKMFFGGVDILVDQIRIRHYESDIYMIKRSIVLQKYKKMLSENIATELLKKMELLDPDSSGDESSETGGVS